MDASPAPVSLEQMLEARDRRAARQQAALARFGEPVVSATVVMPGAIKDTGRSRTILQAAVTALDRLFAERAWPVLLFAPVSAPTGPEALYAVAADAMDLKQALVDIEDSHPLGRLWDLDVIDPRRGIIARRDLGRPPRRCLLCDDWAHACARSRRHPLAELLAVIADMVDAYDID
jgi:holo-ACP synthase